jgi:hypothetical protein
MHTLDGEWRFASPHPSWSIYGHCVGCSQHPKTKCPKLARINQKHQKRFPHLQFSFCKLLKVTSFHMGFHVNSNNYLLVIPSLDHIRITHDTCIHLKCGHGNEPPFRNWSMTTFGSFCHKVIHLFYVLGEQSLCNTCNATHVNFAHPFQL